MAANLFTKAIWISLGEISNASSRGTSKGSLNSKGELHRNVEFVRTISAVDEDMYLKKLFLSCFLFSDIMVIF